MSETCPSCGDSFGTGCPICDDGNVDWVEPTDTDKCARCNGNGRIEALEHCPACHGSGMSFEALWRKHRGIGAELAELNRKLTIAQRLLNIREDDLAAAVAENRRLRNSQEYKW